MAHDCGDAFIYHFPEHNLWAYFPPHRQSLRIPGALGYLQSASPPTQTEYMGGRTVQWFDCAPTMRAVFEVKPRRVLGYKRRSDAPATLPEFVNDVDERLEDLYEAQVEAAEYRHEDVDVRTITLDRAPGRLIGGWVSQLPYSVLVDPICAASAPCVLPEGEVWGRVTKGARAVVKSTPGLCIVEDYESLGHVSIGKQTGDGKRIAVLHFMRPEYRRGKYSNAGVADPVICTDIHAPSMAEGEAVITAMLARVTSALGTPTRACPRCSGCGEIAFNEPDVKPAPPPEPLRKSPRR